MPIPAPSSPDSILSHTSHRPWPLPDLPWIMFQQWSDLLFAHWALDPALVRPLVPEQLDLDLFDGKAWIAITPFRMTDIRFRALPPLPGAGSFLEMNLRTYVRSRPHARDPGTKPGVFFFSLDASNLPAVLGARIGLGLPYFWSDMSAEETAGDIHYTSRRRHSPAAVEVRYRPSPLIPQPSALELFLTERYCLYEVRLGIPIRTQIQHAPWPLQNAEATFTVNTVGTTHNLPLTLQPDLLLFSKQLDVLIYPPG